MRYLVVRTQVRPVVPASRTASDGAEPCRTAPDGAQPFRDELRTPEPRRQVFGAADREAALCMARALSTVGAVRSGRHRVKVLRVVSADQ